MNTNKPVADITLILEGTYPYMSGGVSCWVHQLISGLPQFTFSLIFIGSTKDSYSDTKFKLPANVTNLESIFLWEHKESLNPRERSGSKSYFRDISSLHEWFRCPKSKMDPLLFKRILLGLADENGTAIEDFFFSEASWDFICEQYSASSDCRSGFTDYFWTIRLMHAPLFKLTKGALSVPLTRAFHSVSNGYAGFLAMMLHYLTGRPFILTEHGIYAKERKIDLQAFYIHEHRDYFNDPPRRGMKDHHFLWIKHFEALSRFVYTAANPILSCHEGNRRRQIREGADSERTKIIPNGININHYIPLRAKRNDKIPLVLGLIGRTVPIKDIKTFIRAVRTVVTALPTAEGWLIGPDAEDPQYCEECKQLAANLGLENNLRFLGFQDLDEIFPKLGILVITSISEAFPLVLLEAFATGLPVVTTDVGACRELIEGNSPEDKALGCAGSVVPIADPEATAKAALALLMDEKWWLAAQRAAIARVELYYSEPRFLEAYGKVYQTAVGF